MFHWWIRFSSFCVVTQRVLTVVHRRLGTAYRSHFQVSSSHCSSRLLHPWNSPKKTTNIHCVTTQKSESHIYISAEAWNLAYLQTVKLLKVVVQRQIWLERNHGWVENKSGCRVVAYIKVLSRNSSRKLQKISVGLVDTAVGVECVNFQIGWDISYYRSGVDDSPIHLRYYAV